MAVAVAEWMILVAVLVALGGYVGLVLVITELKKWVPEWRTFSQARKTGMPVLALTVAGSGETDLILGTKDEKGDPVFDTQGQFGIQTDPKFTGELVPDRLVGGLKIYHYCTTRPLAIDSRNALAIQRVISTVRANYPQLDFLTNDQLNALLNTPRNDLYDYCVSFCDMCGPTMAENGIADEADLANTIKAAQNLLSTDVVSEGWISYAYAFKNISTAYLSQDMHQYSMLIERKIRKQMEDLGKKMTLIMTFGVIIIGIIIAGAVAIQIIG